MSDATMHYGRILQDGQVVVSVSGEHKRLVLSEIAHYASLYGQDGPVIVQTRSGKSKWRTIN